MSCRRGYPAALAAAFLLVSAFWVLDAAPAPKAGLTEADGVVFGSVIDLILQNRQADAKRLAEGKLAAARGETETLLLRYLSGDPAVSEACLAFSAEEDGGLWAFCSLAVFVRKLSESGAPPRLELSVFLDNFRESAAGSDNRELMKFYNRSGVWASWLSGGLRRTAGLEPLLAAKSSSGGGAQAGAPGKSRLAAVSARDFEESRRFFAKRPWSDSLSFEKADLQKYLDALPDKELRRAEFDRIAVITRVKPYLVKILAPCPYTGEIALKKETFQGVVIMANDSSLRIKREGASESRNIKWQDLDFKQYINFFEFFASTRLKSAGGGTVSHSESVSEAAEDYIMLSLLCDWRGRYSEALRFARAAASTDPAKTEETENLLLGPAR
jgi:hypothetical protein